MGGKGSGRFEGFKTVLPSKEDASETLISSDSYQWIPNVKCPNCNALVGYYTKGEKTQHACTVCGALVTIHNTGVFVK